MAQHAVATDAAQTRPAGGPSSSRWHSLRRYALIFLALLVVGIGANTVIVSRLPGMTPVDGMVYVDALLKAGDRSVAAEGDTIDPRALDVVACRGLYEWGSLMMLCGPDGRAVRNAEFALLDASHTSAHVHPPTYFFATAWLERAVGRVLPGDQDTIDLARILGGVWFALGALLLVRAAALWGAHPWAAAVALMAFVPTPTFVSLFSFVTPDAMGLLVSAAAVLGVTLWWQRRMPAWPLFAFGLLTSAAKQTFLLAAVAGALVLLALWYFRRSRGFADTARAAAWLLGGAAAGVFGWEIISGLIARAAVTVAPSGFERGASFETITGLLFTPALGIPSSGAADLVPWPDGATAAALGLGFLAAAAAGGALLHRNRGEDPVFALALGGVVAFMLGGLLVSLLTLFADGVLLPAAPRYAFGAWPFFVLPLLLVARRPWVWSLAGALGVLGICSWIFWAPHVPPL